jgi:hypothetical protein
LPAAADIMTMPTMVKINEPKTSGKAAPLIIMRPNDMVLVK